MADRIRTGEQARRLAILADCTGMTMGEALEVYAWQYVQLVDSATIPIK